MFGKLPLFGLGMTMQTAELYNRFVAALRQNVRAFDAAENDEQRLAAALAILRGIVLYLQGDEEIFEERLARPLGWLESAIYDSAQGASPAALKPASPLLGRPTKLARDEVQGTLAFGVELLVMGAKVPADDAAKFVARRCRTLVFTESGDEITPEQVAGWRRELRRNGGTIGGRETFRAWRQEYRRFFDAPSVSQRKLCEAQAFGLIKGISTVAPRSAPNRRGKRP